MSNPKNKEDEGLKGLALYTDLRSKRHSAEELTTAISLGFLIHSEGVLLTGVFREMRGILVDLQKKLLDRIDALEARLAEVEGAGIKYLGVFQKSMIYERGNLATLDGALW